MKSESIYGYDNDNVLRLKNELNKIYGKYDDILAKFILQECERRTDFLTGLPNIESFREIINQRLSNGQYGTLFIIDISEFSLINREYGYEAGNSVIASIGENLKFKNNFQTISGYLGSNRFGVYSTLALSSESAYELFNIIRVKIDNVLNKFIPLNSRCVVTPLSKELRDLNDK